MSSTLLHRPARVTVALALTLVAGVAAGLTLAPPAQAGHNYGSSGCITAYNYADPATDYLFASTDAYGGWGGEPCAFVEVTISTDQCYGNILAHRVGAGYVSASAAHPFYLWSNPCSTHTGDTGGTWMWLAFLY